MTEDPESELPDDDDVIIWHLQDRDDLDAYRVTKGSAKDLLAPAHLHAPFKQNAPQI
jgi:hypothetical protein